MRAEQARGAVAAQRNNRVEAARACVPTSHPYAFAESALCHNHLLPNARETKDMTCHGRMLASSLVVAACRYVEDHTATLASTLPALPLITPAAPPVGAPGAPCLDCSHATIARDGGRDRYAATAVLLCCCPSTRTELWRVLCVARFAAPAMPRVMRAVYGALVMPQKDRRAMPRAFSSALCSRVRGRRRKPAEAL